MIVESENLNGRVTVDIWTPAQYELSSDVKYPVLYAHDGQNLFDPSYTFAGVPWGIDKACSLLANDPNFVMPIIVGINNRGAIGLRPNDYFPEKSLDYIPDYQIENTFSSTLATICFWEMRKQPLLPGSSSRLSTVCTIRPPE